VRTFDGADVFVNEDLMPEIEKPIGLRYLYEIKRKLRYLLSINQECIDRLPNGHVQGLVHALVEEIGGFMRTRHRSMPGYAVEWYRTES
jgi:hypothetical protein